LVPFRIKKAVLIPLRVSKGPQGELLRYLLGY